MSGPSAAELEEPVATEKWKALYAKMGQEWGTSDIAQIGETKYSTLTAAFREATNGCTVKLLSNVALDGTLSFAPDTAVNFTLDGAGFTVSGGNYTLLSLGANVTCIMKNITFQSGNGGGTGTLDLAGADVTLDNGAKVTNSGTDRVNLGNSEWVGVSITKNGGKLTVNTLDSYSLSLNDDIGINFYAALSDNETKLSATLPNGKVVAMRLSDANQKTAKFGLLNLYRFTVNVSAADMTAEIPVKLEAAGNTDDVTVSIVRYAKQILSDNAYSESAKALVTAMLHYGAAAQTFFEKNPDNLANKDLTAPDFSAITVAASYAPSVTGSAEGLTYFGSSLLLKGKTVIRHYFRLADGKSISDYQFKLGETVLTATQYKDTELYFVEITGIKSSDLTTAYTVTVGDLTVTYSAMSYAYTALTAEGVDDTLAATVKALVNYANAAKTYFAAN